MPRTKRQPAARDYKVLEAALDYRFDDDKWLRRALVHSSARARKDIERDNERLEFLGDRVLGLTIAELLFLKFPDANEGALARTFNTLVRKEACAEVAARINLGDFLELGDGELKAGGRRKQAILGDACEAIIAAVFLDGGFDRARRTIERLWSHLLEIDSETRADPKTTLQEWAQGRGMPLPVYEDVGRSGPDHRPLFTMEVRIDGLEPGTGTGENKRAAQQAAARLVLEREGVWEADDANA